MRRAHSFPFLLKVAYFSAGFKILGIVHFIPALPLLVCNNPVLFPFGLWSNCFAAAGLPRPCLHCRSRLCQSRTPLSENVHLVQGPLLSFLLHHLQHRDTTSSLEELGQNVQIASDWKLKAGTTKLAPPMYALLPHAVSSAQFNMVGLPSIRVD